MGYHQCIVPLWRELAASSVGDGDIVKSYARFEGEGGYNSNMLIWYEGCERVFRLSSGSLYGI